MKKNSVIAVLVVVLLLALAGCGKGAEPEPASTRDTGGESASTMDAGRESASTGDSEGETGQEDEDVQVSSDRIDTGRPVIGLSSVYIYEADDSRKTTYLKGSYDITRIVEDSAGKYKALSDALDRDMKEKADKLEKERKEETQRYKEDETAKEMAPSGYELNNNVYIHRADSKVLSALEVYSGYSGGAHGYYTYDAWNYDAQTGEKIPLDDVIADKDRLAEALKTALKKKYTEDVFFEDMGETIDKEIHEIKEDGTVMKSTWTLDPQGITFYYSPYEIGSWASGSFSATIFYNEGDGIFTDRYRPQKDEGHIVSLPFYTLYSVDVDKDGKADQVQIDQSMDADKDMITDLTVSLNGKELKLDVECFDAEPRLVLTADGRAFLYSWCQGYDDSVDLYMADLSSGTPESRGSMNLAEGYVRTEKDTADGKDSDTAAADKDTDGTDKDTADSDTDTADMEADEESPYTYYEILPTDPDHMLLSTRFDILSTYEGSKIYNVSDSPVPVSHDPYYLITGEITLTSVKEITAPAVDEQGKVSKEAVKIPAGSTFTLVRTDGKKIVDARLADGSMVRLEVTEDFPPYINGVDANELFEQLYYAS